MNAPPLYGDFHLHSNCSDGEFPPSKVIDIVADAGVGVAALTDHDTLAGQPEAQDRARARGITLIIGIEMTAYAAGQIVHVLGLGVDPNDGAIAIANEIASDVWSKNQLRWIESLERDGFAISPGRDFSDRPLRLPVLIARLCERGVDGGDPRACHARFREFFSALGPDAFARLPSPSKTAQTIRDAGGLAILAHPGRLRGNGTTQRFLADVDGIEALYGPYDPGEREALRSLAVEQGKLYSCGSDYHGFFNGPYVNPLFEAPRELLERLGS
jgi:predicted metal-dependent phosphoesterase TrpH